MNTRKTNRKLSGNDTGSIPAMGGVIIKWGAACVLGVILGVAFALTVHAAQAAAFPEQAEPNAEIHSDAPLWRIKVKDAAVVPGDVVLLGDIADMIGTVDEQAWEKLAATTLWNAPPSKARPMVISRKKLHEALQHYLPREYRWCQIPDRLVLRRGGRIVDQNTLRKTVIETIRPLVSTMKGEARLREFRLPTFLFLQDELDTLRVTPSRKVEPGRLAFFLEDVAPDGKVRRKVSGSVFLDLWVTVPAAQHPINRTDVVTPDKITFVKKNAAFMRYQPWDGKGGPWRVKRPVGTKQVLFAENLELIPLISKGDTVTLAFQGPHIRLEVPAEALSDGSMGETITVRNLQSNRQVVATVQSQNLVTIHK